MKPLVEARGLALPGRLENSSLTLGGGQLACLIGPNGSGKTSLLHALAGIGDAAGSVSIAGVNPRSLVPEQRQRLLSYLPASRDVHWPLRARDLVRLGTAGAGDDAMQALFRQLELTDFADRPVDRLSTGERSRVLIARALLARPRLLLLDEPVANLDPLWQLRLMDQLRRIATEQECALLVAVHDLELARSFADRLIIMNAGRIVADGDPEELLSGPDIPAVFGIKWAEGRWQPLA